MTETKNKSGKIIFIFLSIIIVAYTLTGNIISSDQGSVSLIFFESFYVYIIAIIISLYNALNNKNPNISIIIALATYPWTYYLVHQMFEYITDIEMTIETNFYIYLSSSIFLIISLFINNKKEVSNNEKLKQDGSKSNSILNDDLNENNFIFTNSVIGFKEIPYNATVLLVNNTPSNTIDLIYTVNDSKQTKKLPLDIIKNISYVNKVKVSNSQKKVESNETKSMLLSAVVFGGNPLLQMAGNSGFNNLFDSLSNNYDKVNFNIEYEITIQILVNNEEQKLVFISENNPEIFINKILNK